jgi:hypothetical protein
MWASNVPAAQLVQLLICSAEYLPLGQSEQDTAPAAENLPCLHGMHEFATAPAVDKNLPAVQLLQMLAPTAAAKVPEGHAPQIAEASFENWPEGQGEH